MIKFYNKTKYGIVLLLVLSMILQVAGPLVNYAYGEEGAPPIVENITEEDDESKDSTEPAEPENSTGTDEETETEKDEEALEPEQPIEEEAIIGPTEEGKEGEITTILSEPKDLGNIFTLISLKVNGEEASENMVVTIGDGTTVNLDYTWDTVGKDAKSGDYAEMDIPDAFKLDKNFEDKDIVLSGGEIVGKYSIVDNKLRFVFNNEIENVGEVTNGVLGFEVKFNEEKFQEDVVEEIEFNDRSNKNITIIGKPSATIKSINKLGIPDRTTNASKITWTVDITNPSDEAITNAKFKDKLPEGLELEPVSIKVKDLNIKLNGDLSEGSVVTVASPAIDGQNFELDLPTIAPYKGYRIEYTTIITDRSKTQFTNDAAFEHGGNSLLADATVNIERSSSIEKNGEYKGYNKDKKYDEIDWWIDVNKSGGSIDAAIIEDTLPVELTLVEGSIDIFKLTQSGNDWTESDSDKTASGFPVDLGSIDDAHRIRFKTSIDYSQVNDGEYQINNSFINKTILKDGTEKIGDAETTVDFNRDPILGKTGKQFVDYENKEIKWIVTVNKANHPIDGAIVTDTLPAGLTISKDNIKVLKGSEDVTSNVTITVPTNNGLTPTEVKIGLGNINEKYTIEYTTKITDFNIDKFLNEASLGGTGVGPGGTIKPVPVEPNKNDYGKSHTGINYDEKIMNWQTVANPTREAFKTFKITDTFPNDGLILLPDTLEVKIGGEVKTLDTDYTLTPINGNYNNGFVVEFKESVLPINNKLAMTYTTSYDPEKGIKTNTGGGLYKNHVHFEGETENGNSVDVTKDAHMQVNKETINTGKKLGKLKSIDSKGNLVDGWVSGNERKIEWEIYTNYLKQNLGSGVSITDELGYEGEIDKDSIQVRKYTVAPGGGTELGDDINTAKLQLMQLLSTGKYSVEMGENNKSFTLTFNEAVNERYVIIFTTSVPDISLGKDKYTNTATMKVGDKEYPYTGSTGFDKADNNLSKSAIDVTGDKVYTDDEVNWRIKINEGLSLIQKDVTIVDTISKGLVYKNDSLKVYKLTGVDRVLVGTDQYSLNVATNENHETILTLVFNDKISSTYEIEYTTIVTATTGLVNNKVDYSGKNLKVKTIETKKLNAEQFSYVGGDPSKGKIIINKVDSEGKKITSEAEFKVYYILNGDEQLVGGQTYKTVDSKVEIANLNLNRTYYIREISAPNGFKFDESEYPIEVLVNKAAGNNNSGAFKYDIENDNIKTEVKGKKVWKDGPEVKPDIKLQLYQNGQPYGSPVTLEDGETEHTWEGLNLTDNAGEVYKYTVDEIDLPNDYEKMVSVDGSTTTIFNTYEVKRTEITGRKIWVDGPELKPDIRLQLYQNGDSYGDPVTLLSGNTSYTWKNLPLSDKFGNLFTYTIDELNGPDNYEQNKKLMYGKSRSADGLTVTNTYKSPKTDVTGRKVWNNGPEVKPTIELQLYRNGEALGEPVKLTNGTFEYIWKDLDLTDNDGVNYIYTVKEVGTAENYTKVEEGQTVTNTYVSPKTEVTGRKVWVGGPEVKPTIELQLYRKGEALGAPVELEDGETTYTWEDLDLTDENGINYDYTVQEVNVPKNYETTEEGLTVTNTYVSPKTEVLGTKIWLYGPEVKPTIELQLYRNGVALEDYKVELENGTTEYKWTDLDLTDEDGVEYVYTIDEVNTPANYGKSISEDKLTVTNKYKSPITEITGRKVWINGPKVKPTIELQLYRNGEALGVPVELKDGETEYTWTELDRTDINGVEYVYTLDEVKVPSSYRKTISENGLTITNRYTPPVDPEEPYNPEVPSDPEGRIKIVKKDNKTNDLLSGAEFDIVDSRGRRVDTLRTNSRGEATSKWLPIGNYTIEEVKAPEGYKLETSLGKERVRNGETLEIVIYNEKEDPTEPEKPVEPVKPVDPEDIEKPTEPTDPTTPDDEFEDVDGGNPSDRPEGEDEFEDGGGKNPSGKPKLPKTGSASPIVIYGLGGLSILVGAMLRRKED